jgi:hypothetical protein
MEMQKRKTNTEITIYLSAKDSSLRRNCAPSDDQLWSKVRASYYTGRHETEENRRLKSAFL